MDTLNKINELTEQLVLDGKKFFDGNKSAGTRTRKIAQELKLLLQELRTEILTEKNVKSIRPGFGMHTKYIKEILGKKAKQTLLKGTPLQKDLIE
jgi:sialic acid synthase SpsE